MMLFLAIVPLSNTHPLVMRSQPLKPLGKVVSFKAKTDVKSAFRIIPIHPADNSLLGTKFHNLVPPHRSSSSS